MPSNGKILTSISCLMYLVARWKWDPNCECGLVCFLYTQMIVETGNRKHITHNMLLRHSVSIGIHHTTILSVSLTTERVLFCTDEVQTGLLALLASSYLSAVAQGLMFQCRMTSVTWLQRFAASFLEGHETQTSLLPSECLILYKRQETTKRFMTTQWRLHKHLERAVCV